MTATTSVETQTLAILGGPKAVPVDSPALFHWPIVTAEDEQAVLNVLRAGSMSGTGLTRQFEAQWGQYLGTTHNLAHCNGTMALLAAMFAVGVGRGDEIIVPSMTYWASAAQSLLLGATPVFADVQADSLCIDPADIQRRITPRTKAIVVVHYCGHPCDMDAILPIARKHGIMVIEDVSHAQGTRYKGRLAGSLGDIAGISMMGGKSFAIGEGGMLSTNDPLLYQRAVAFCHYERIASDVTDPELLKSTGPGVGAGALPLGALKGRINQTCSAMGMVQLKHYPQRIKTIQAAINRFWDLLADVPGLSPHRPTDPDSDMGGWYNPIGHYRPEELHGLPVQKFIEAVNAEGGRSGRGTNFPLHPHPLFHQADVFHDGKPTAIAFTGRDTRQGAGTLPVTEKVNERTFGIPYFKHDEPEKIAQYAAAFRKVALQASELVKR